MQHSMVVVAAAYVRDGIDSRVVPLVNATEKEYCGCSGSIIGVQLCVVRCGICVRRNFVCRNVSMTPAQVSNFAPG